MSQTVIKFTVPAALAYSLHQTALAHGTTTADIARRAYAEYIGTPKPIFDDALIEKQTDDAGHTIVGAYLSNQLATAVKRLAAERGHSTSHVLRDLVRTALRDLPTTAPMLIDPVDQATP